MFNMRVSRHCRRCRLACLLHAWHFLQLTEVDERVVTDLPIVGSSDDEVDEDAAPAPSHPEDVTSSAPFLETSSPFRDQQPDFEGDDVAEEADVDAAEDSSLQKAVRSYPIRYQDLT